MTKQELASKIWAMADKMRSKIKANEYKDYILGFMFYKFLSDKEKNFLSSMEMTQEELKNMDESDIAYIKENIGYAISYNNLFSTWKERGIELTVKDISEALQEFNKNICIDQKNVFENIFSTLQNGLSKLGDSSGSRDKAVRDIVDMIDTIPTNSNEGYDVLGYIYEYLIYKFATAAKDDGAFYTPHEVSSLLSQIVAWHLKDKNAIKVYDPTSGSGSLLLNIGEECARYISKENIKYFGQENITETFQLTRMNLVMKDVPAQNIVVRNGDTLEDDWPYFDENTAYMPLFVNAVVSNPPYSWSWETEGKENDERFKKYGLAPRGKADYAFLLHCLYHLENDGVMGIVLPHGVLFRGDSEYQIRKNLCIEHNIDTIIGLPANLFYATGIPTIIMILKKNRANDDILFIDASQSFQKGKKQNVLRDCDIKKIFDTVVSRQNVPNFARVVPYSEIEANDFNLNIPRYVNANSDTEDFDFAALMYGTVPDKELEKFNVFWSAFSGLKDELFHDLGNGYRSFNTENIGESIRNYHEVQSFRDTFNMLSEELKEYLIKTLIAERTDEHERVIKDNISAKLFEIVKDLSIVDKYEVYQMFSDYWINIENDLKLIGNNPKDLSVCNIVDPKYKIKKTSRGDVEIQDGWEGRIIPFDIVRSCYFETEDIEIRTKTEQINLLQSENDEIFEGLEEDVKSAVGEDKFKEKELKIYIKSCSDDNLKQDLEKVLVNMTNIKSLTKELSSVENGITEKIKDIIENLSTEEIKNLLAIKWVMPIVNDFCNILDKVIGNFSRDLENIKKKYEHPLSEIDAEIKSTSQDLALMIDELVGSDIDMQALQLFKETLL